MELRHQKIGACMQRKYGFIGIQRGAIGSSLRSSRRPLRPSPWSSYSGVRESSCFRSC